MSEITVRALSEDEWETYREVRLAALEESPDAFVASHEAEAAEPEQFWRDRMDRSHRLLAESDGDKVGVVSIGGARGRRLRPRAGPEPPLLLGRHRQRPWCRLREQLRLPAHGPSSPDACPGRLRGGDRDGPRPR
jgi:hypothetical protein